MTLMEVVIAIGVVAFVIPLIMAVTGSAADTRRSAESDTRSAWLVREVQQEILAAWAVPPHPSNIGTSVPFPTFADASSPEILAYDSDGKFIAKGTAQDLTAPSKIPKAAYLITAYGESYNPPNIAAAADSLSLIRISVLHPAKAAPGKRNTFRYNLISPRQGTL
jgi:type II secretory pathway pseudopilin PulG